MFKKSGPQQHAKRTVVLAMPLLRLVLCASALGADVQESVPQPATTSSLMSRVGTPTDLALSEFRQAGMEEVRLYELTAEGRAKVKAALDALPPLNRDA